jgi:hypothetical protein
VAAGTIALDWEGVLHSGPEAQWPPAEFDLDLIGQLQARAYAVAVMTCNDVNRGELALPEQHGDGERPGRPAGG